MPEKRGKKRHNRASSGRPTPGELQTIRSQLLRQPGAVAELIRVRPMYQDGVLIGYEVQPGPNPRLFHRLDLHPGDVVTRINGTPATPRYRFRLLRIASRAQRIDLTLWRHGRPVTLEFSFQSLEP